MHLAPSTPSWTPIGKAAFMPLGRYLAEPRRATDDRREHGKALPVATLGRAFEQAIRDNLSDLAEAGPIGAALKATAIAGRQIENATAFVSSKFGRLSAMGHAPKCRQSYYLKDVTDRVRERATDNVRRREGAQ